jgi:hypothetical protein
MKFWFKAALLVAAAAIIPACKANSKLAAPTVVAVRPDTLANTGIGRMPNILVKFDREMDPAFMVNQNFAVIPDGATGSIPITVEFLPVVNTVRIIPNSFLLLNKGYTAAVSGSVKSAAGTPLGSSVGWVFTTVAADNATSLISFGTVTQTAGGNPGEIILAWPTATESTSGGTVNVTTYDVYISTTSGGEDLFLPPALSSGGLTGATLTGLTPATPYFIKVQPRDANGNVLTNLAEMTATSN